MAAADPPANAIIIHTIDPEHYGSNEEAPAHTSDGGESSSSGGDSDSEGESQQRSKRPSPRVSPRSKEDSTRQMLEQLPSPAARAASSSGGGGGGGGDTNTEVAAPPAVLGTVTQRAFKEAAGGLGGSIFSACCVYVRTHSHSERQQQRPVSGGRSIADSPGAHDLLCLFCVRLARCAC